MNCALTSATRQHAPLIVWALVCAAGCAPGTPTTSTNPPTQTPKVAVATVAGQRLENRIVVPAEVEGFEQAPLMAKIDAYIEEVKVDIGDEVAADAILITLEAPELTHEVTRRDKILEQARADLDVRDAELRSAEAQLREKQAVVDLRQSEHERTEGLVRRRALGEQKLAEAQFRLESARSALVSQQNAVAVAQAHRQAALRQVDVAQAELDQAKAMAGYREIRAPFGGVITERNADVGEFVRPATQGGSVRPLVTLVRVTKLRSIVYLTMDQAALVENGNPAVLVLDDLPGAPYEGSITRNAKSYGQGTRMLRAEMDVTNSHDPSSGAWKYRPGSYGTMTIVVASQQLPVVPRTAVGKAGGRAFVMLLDAENACRQRFVDIAMETDDLAGIAGGLRIGDRVVAEDPGQVEQDQQLPGAALVEWEIPKDVAG